MRVVCVIGVFAVSVIVTPLTDRPPTAADGGRTARSPAPAVAGLLPQLRHPKAAVRLAAVEALGRIGPPARTAVPDLLAVQSDADPAVRRGVAVAILAILSMDAGWHGGLDLLPTAVGRSRAEDVSAASFQSKECRADAN
jgi:HEAT repeats